MPIISEHRVIGVDLALFLVFLAVSARAHNICATVVQTFMLNIVSLNRILNRPEINLAKKNGLTRWIFKFFPCFLPQ